MTSVFHQPAQFGDRFDKAGPLEQRQQLIHAERGIFHAGLLRAYHINDKCRRQINNMAQEHIGVPCLNVIRGKGFGWKILEVVGNDNVRTGIAAASTWRSS